MAGRAQVLDIALTATAEPDEYDISVRATGAGQFSAIMNMVVTVRWEAAAGGTISESSLYALCPEFRVMDNNEGVVTYGNYNYYTLIMDSFAPLGTDCPFSTAWVTIARIRIDDLQGCWNVGFANDAYTAGTNKNYYISIGGLNRTGAITTAPIPGGECPPCEPPQVLTIATSGIAGCTGPADLWVEATGSALLYAWSGPPGAIGWADYPVAADSLHLSNAVAGTYTVVVENLCGSVSASINMSPVPCTAAPEIIGISGSFVNQVDCNGQLTLNATLTQTGLCETYRWLHAGNVVGQSLQPAPFYGAYGAYTFIVTSPCGSDTALVMVEDEGACVPPTVEGITLLTAPCASPTLQLQASVEPGSSCISYTWTTPTGQTVSAGPNATLPTAYGTYQFIATNSCGSDTATFALTVDPACEAPEILQWMHSPFDCIGEAVTVHAQFGGTCVQAVLHRPSGGQVNLIDSVQVLAQSGQYMVVATNGCGSDTLYFTLTMPACVPPQVLSQWGDTVLCANSELLLQPVVQVTGCYTVQWQYPTTPTNTSNELVRRFPTPATGTYALTVSNGCGSASIAMDVLVGIAVGQTSCSTGPVIDLDASLPAGFPDGQWELNGVPHGNLVDPAVDVTGSYMYQTVGQEGGCGEARVDMLIGYPFDPGTNGSVALCSNDAPIALIDYVGGTPDTGGTFTYGLLQAYFGDIYDPAVDWPRTFRYMHNGPCGYVQSLLTVTETPATAWYPDTDADGLGDTLMMVLSCDTVPGHVANAGDACPLVAGTVGSPCDDGLAWTSNDLLDAACACTGDLTTGLSEGDVSGVLVWPNPNSDGRLFIRLAEALSGHAQLVFYNMLGDAVSTTSVRNSADHATVEVDLAGLAAGVYQLEIHQGLHRFSERLIIAR